MLRASDRDRDVVVEILGEAYADGRLDREEFDARAGAVSAAKLLGDLPPLVEDLVARDGAAEAPVVSSPADLREQATQAWRRDLRNAVGGWAGPSVITTGVWGALAVSTQDPSFFWPVFVILGTGINVARTVFSKQEIIERKREKLAHRQRKEIEDRERGRGESDD
ncbi:MAG: DUF1707 SHOCT-like domain-containing protein [Nocardioidaceae bacterium]